MDAATAKKIVSLLNQILQRESGTTSPTEDTNRKLDEILDFVRTQAEQSRGLTETVAPRFIWYSARGSKSNIDVLKTFSGWSVRIESIRDVEAEKAARNLGGLLSQAGWNLENNAVLREESMPDGVTVDQYQAPEMEENPTGVSLEMRSAAVVDEIVAFLLANNWDAHAGWSKHGELKPNELRIRVGFKSAPYFMPEPFKKRKMVNKRAEEIRKDIQSLNEGDPSPAPNN